MISQAALARFKQAEPCPTLAGKTFNIYLGHGWDTPVFDGTVTIAADLSYTTDPGGSSGQLVADPTGSGNYTYSEAGPPAVSGGLICWDGVWYFQDHGKGAVGHIREGTL